MKMKLTSILVTIAACAIVNAEPPKGGEKGKGKGPRGERPVPKEMLEKFDKDGDGKISMEERKAAMEARKAEMLAKYDKDGDGKLSADERKVAMADRKAEMMKKFDKDGDGKLSAEEKAEMRKAMAPGRGGPRGGGDRPRGGRGGKKPAGE